ncbi:MAG: hypothetical protein LBL66_03835 [Clostridiales bacterium]|jgi:uncharacterized membrane protein|nr:hypothetical protein [Clostridiales bacterium]
MKKIKSYTFWFKTLSAVALAVSLAGQVFGFKVIDFPAANEIAAAVCGLLLLVGFIAKDDPPTGGDLPASGNPPTGGDPLDGGGGLSPDSGGGEESRPYTVGGLAAGIKQ